MNDELNGDDREGVEDILEQATREVEAVRVSTSGGASVREAFHVVVEDALTIAIEGVGEYALMCTPHDATALAVGFAFSEGLIAGADDIKALARCEDDPGVIRIRVADPTRAGKGQAVEQLRSAIPAVGDLLRIPAGLLRGVAEEMRERQAIFSQTGGSHAAGIFSPDSTLIALGEDIGRHNALDKALGQCLLAGRSTAGCGAVLSGRVSLELVAKCARAGIELMAAVSAPSSLAIEAAEGWNITLCAFVRGDRATVFSHERRVAYGRS